MSWWAAIDTSRFIQFRQEALRRRPDFQASDTLPAEYLAAHQVGLPFVLTLDDYAAFMALSTDYIESKERGAPLPFYHLGCTVLMWHFTIWDYIGQFINALYGQRFEKREVSFAHITSMKVVRAVPRERIAPILPTQLEDFISELRRIWKAGQSPLKIRNIGTHRYHPANTITQELDDLLTTNEKNSHAVRMRALQEKVLLSFNSLINAQIVIRTFLDIDEVKLWNPYWFSFDYNMRG